MTGPRLVPVEQLEPGMVARPKSENVRYPVDIVEFVETGVQHGPWPGPRDLPKSIRWFNVHRGDDTVAALSGDMWEVFDQADDPEAQT